MPIMHLMSPRAPLWLDVEGAHFMTPGFFAPWLFTSWLYVVCCPLQHSPSLLSLLPVSFGHPSRETTVAAYSLRKVTLLSTSGFHGEWCLSWPQCMCFAQCRSVRETQLMLCLMSEDLTESSKVLLQPKAVCIEHLISSLAEMCPRQWEQPLLLVCILLTLRLWRCYPALVACRVQSVLWNCEGTLSPCLCRGPVSAQLLSSGRAGTSSSTSGSHTVVSWVRRALGIECQYLNDSEHCPP